MNKKPKSSYPFSDENNPTMRLDLFTWPEVDEYLRHCKGIILPIGSTEQHGPTGAIGTDALTAKAVAHEVGKRTGVLVSPTQPYGMAEHHLGFAGTMSLRPETLLELVHDLLISLSMHGFEKIFIVNGHGGNIATIKAAFSKAYRTISTSKFSETKLFQCKLANWFMTPEVFKEAHSLYGDKEGQHATPSEIALTLYLEPSLLSKQCELPPPSPSGPIYDYKDFRQRYFDGRMGSDPFLANARDGEKLLDKAASVISKNLLDFLQEP